MRDPQFTEKQVLGGARLKSLAASELLDTPPEQYFDRITRLVCKLVGAQTALLSLVTDERQFFKSSCGFSGPAADARETPLSHSFCKYVVTTGKPFAVSDARRVAKLEGHGAVEDLGVVSYLGVPVHAPDGQIIGSLCALNGEAREWLEADLATLTDLAAMVDDDLALRAQARRAHDLARDNAILAREYHHRVKNTLAVSAALVRLSGKETLSKDEVVRRASERLLALADAHDHLIADSDSVALKDLSSRLLRPYCAHGAGADVDGPAVMLTHHQVTPICFFLHELATNSAKYGAFKRGKQMTLRWVVSDGSVTLDWVEDLSGAEPRSPEGFGSKLIEMAAKQLQGAIRMDWSGDQLTVSLAFPHGEDRR